MFRAALPRFFKPNADISRLMRSGSFVFFSTKITSSNPLPYITSQTQEHSWDKNSTITHDGHKSKKLSLTIHPTKKEHLEPLQRKLGNLKFSFEQKRHDPEIIFIYSNDLKATDYLPEMSKCFTKKWKVYPTNYLGDFLRIRKPKFKVGIVIGNGAILSLLPEIQASDIILLDKEPAVHLFVLQIKKLLLEYKDYNDFNSVRQTLIEKINQLAQLIMPSKNTELATEMEKLGDLHFLANKNRLDRCIDALLKKDLIPINLDIFSDESMSDFIMLLIQSFCEISFMNLTNIAEFDKKKVLYSIISKMPFAKNFNVFATSRFSDNPCCYHLNNLSDVKNMLDTVTKNAFKQNDIINSRFSMSGKI